MGGRCSDDGLAEPMILLVLSLSAPEYGGALFRRRARRADESRPSGVSFRVFIGSRYSHGGVVLVGVSFRVFIGSRYSLDRLAEPMNRIRPASASEPSSGRVIRTAGSQSR